MFEKLRALFQGPSGAIASRPSGDAISGNTMIQGLMNPSIGASLGQMMLDNAIGGGPIQYGPAIAARRFLSESIATLPLITYRILGDAKERATDHPVYTLLKSKPNDYESAYTFWSAVIGTAIDDGNAFIAIDPNGKGEAAQLTRLNSQYITIEITNGVKSYTYKTPDGMGQKLTDNQVIHIMGYSWDGLVGVPLRQFARGVLIIGMAVEAYALNFFTQGHASGQYVWVPPGTKPEHYEQIVTSWIAAYQGPMNAWKTSFLPYGAELRTNTTQNDSAQLLELRKHQVVELCGLLRVPPHAIFHYISGGTYANLEAQQTDLVVNSLQPWLTQLEQQINVKLFAGTNLQAEFLVDARLRGDTLSRYQAHQIGRQGGWLSTNDIRRMENLPPIEGGDEYQSTPIGGAPNPAPAEQQPEQPAETPAEETPPSDTVEGAK